MKSTHSFHVIHTSHDLLEDSSVHGFQSVLQQIDLTFHSCERTFGSALTSTGSDALLGFGGLLQGSWKEKLLGHNSHPSSPGSKNIGSRGQLPAQDGTMEELLCCTCLPTPHLLLPCPDVPPTPSPPRAHLTSQGCCWLAASTWRPRRLLPNPENALPPCQQC